MWVLDLCAVIMVLCIACAGVCIGAAIVICHDYPEDTEEDSPEKAAPQNIGEQEQKERKRRKQEMENFFNYNGDAMPKSEENEIDVKI